MSQEPDDVTTNISTLSYEVALSQLDALIDKLERGSIPLEEAIAAYGLGAKLAQHCARLLDRTGRRVDQLVRGPAGASPGGADANDSREMAPSEVRALTR